jgi:tRNA 2-thiouridine synthesizing protein A
MMQQKTIDARRLLCPMPVIRLQQGIRGLKSGDLVTLICTDPGALEDVPAWCRIHHHEILLVEEHNNEIIIKISVEPPR